MPHRELFFGQDQLFSLSEAPVVQEEDLEKLILNNPNLIALPNDPHRLFVVRNQFLLSDEEIKNRYALDILMVRDDAIPVLVEVKRCVDTRIKREVVAQMLDYACYLERFNLSDLKKVFCTESDPQSSEYQRYANDDAFWIKVGENLASGNMMLVFAADEIPKSLLDLIDYLQKRFPKTTVYGVEIKEFKTNDKTASVFEREVHYSPKQQSNEKLRAAAHPWTAESYLQHTDQYWPELTETVCGIMEHFTAKYHTKFGNGNVFATINVFDSPSGKQLLSMDISESSAFVWLYPAAKPIQSLLRTEPCLQALPKEYQPKETPQFMKMDVHALLDESVKNWLLRTMDELFKSER